MSFTEFSNSKSPKSERLSGCGSEIRSRDDGLACYRITGSCPAALFLVKPCFREEVVRGGLAQDSKAWSSMLFFGRLLLG